MTHKRQPIMLWHGGCHKCTRQHTESEGVDYCINCCYFDAKWQLPDLNNKPPTKKELLRKEIKARVRNKETKSMISTLMRNKQGEI